MVGLPRRRGRVGLASVGGAGERIVQGLSHTSVTHLVISHQSSAISHQPSVISRVHGLSRSLPCRSPQVKRSNKRLAKELSAWVNAAMSASAPHPRRDTWAQRSAGKSHTRSTARSTTSFRRRVR